MNYLVRVVYADLSTKMRMFPVISIARLWVDADHAKRWSSDAWLESAELYRVLKNGGLRQFDSFSGADAGDGLRRGWESKFQKERSQRFPTGHGEIHASAMLPELRKIAEVTARRTFPHLWSRYDLSHLFEDTKTSTEDDILDAEVIE